ncbi:type IV pilus twitching motility protein PilT [Candidatus Sumerlaeota bacterium]
MSIQDLLIEACEQGASDLHLTCFSPPILRIDGILRPLAMPPLRPNDAMKLIYSLLNDTQRAEFEEKWELDLSVDVGQIGRFRVNVHKQRGCIEAAFRIVNRNVSSLADLGIPEVVGDFMRFENGLVLITGPTGSGKTTTMAAMIDQLNRERETMIITIEDPIEYIFQNERSVVKQREVHSDTRSFGDALRHVLRQDPDVICVGEMRDLETISTTLTAAETGHLVLATIHTPDVMQTIDRVIDVFPPHQQQQIRIQLAATIQGIVAQQLLPLAQGQGRVVACEILVGTMAARQIIRTASTEQMTTLMQTSFELGMITMDKSLKDLYNRGLITYEMALAKCRYPEAFDQM